jgi:hypothetical protein
MATELQYKVFQSAYEEENDRYTQLESRAKFYLTIVTFYLGAVAFKFSDVLVFTKSYRIPAILYIGAGVLLLISLLLTILATRIRAYEAPFDPEKIIRSFTESPPRDAEFLDKRMVDYAVATNRNRKVNNTVGALLSRSSWFLFSALSLQLIVFIIAFYSNANN